MYPTASPNGARTVFHPTGAIRICTPPEDALVLHATARPRRTLGARLNVVLREFARMWVRAQEHRNGF